MRINWLRYQIKQFCILLYCLSTVFLFTNKLSAQCVTDFTADQTSGCAILTVVFTDQSPDATGWMWSFPGADTPSATGQGPHKIKYSTPGKYNVKLDILCGQDKSSEFKENYIVVTDCPCTADFSAQPTTACVGETVTFTDQSSTTADTWVWSFPGGTPSSAQTRGPHNVTYSKPGDYTASLQVYCGNSSDMETKNSFIHINDCTCEASFYGKPTEGQGPLTVTFNNNSTNATSWLWSFPGGDPSSAQGEGPHDITYYQPGYYDVQLEIQCLNNSDMYIIEDYIHVFTPMYEFGDAPEGALAYPSSGTIGKFPACKVAGPAGYIQHGSQGRTFFGPGFDYETDGNGGKCPSFNPDSYN